MEKGSQSHLMHNPNLNNMLLSIFKHSFEILLACNNNFQRYIKNEKNTIYSDNGNML